MWASAGDRRRAPHYDSRRGAMPFLSMASCEGAARVDVFLRVSVLLSYLPTAVWRCVCSRIVYRSGGDFSTGPTGCEELMVRIVFFAHDSDLRARCVLSEKFVSNLVNIRTTFWRDRHVKI